MDARPEWIRESKNPPKIDPANHLAVVKAIRELYREGPHRHAVGTLAIMKNGAFIEPSEPDYAKAQRFCLRGARFLFTQDSCVLSISPMEDEFADFLGLGNVSGVCYFNNVQGYEAVCDLLDKVIAREEANAS